MTAASRHVGGGAGGSFPEAITSYAAITGRNSTFQQGAGYRVLGGKEQASWEDKPVGMALENPLRISFGYAHGAAIRPDRSLEVWGQNKVNNVPWRTGPEGLWFAEWEWRGEYEKGKNFALQETALKTKTWAQIKAEERAGTLKVPGQRVFLAGAIVSWKGKMWEALRENVATEPGTDATVWRESAVQAVQTQRAIDGKWILKSINLGLPWRSPQVARVIDVALAGGRGIALCKDPADAGAFNASPSGFVVVFGHGPNLGAFGTGVKLDWGPKPRPEGEPPAKKGTFHGTLKKGSNVITNLEEVGERHNKVTQPGSASFSVATKAGATLTTPVAVLSALVSGTVSSLPIEALPSGGLPVGSYFLEDSGGHVQAMTVSVAGKKGDTTASVTPVALGAPFAKGSVLSMHVLPVGPKGTRAEVAEATTEEVLDEGGKPFSPPHEKVLTIVMNNPALADYTGPIRIQRPAQERKFSANPPGNIYDAGWPVRVPLPEKATAIAAGTNGQAPFSLALTVTGKVLAWGSNAAGQLGDAGAVGTEKYAASAQYVKGVGGVGLLENIVAIAAGETCCLAINTSGQVLAWGGVPKGAAGKTPYDAGEAHTSTPVVVAGLPTTAGKKPVAVAATEYTAYALLEDGTVRSWGGNEHGELGIGSVAGKASSQWKAGASYSIGAKRSDKGVNYKALHAVSSSTHPGEDPTNWEVEAVVEQPVPQTVLGLSSIRWINGGRFHAGAVDSSGVVKMWGENVQGELANGTSVLSENGDANGTPAAVDLGGRECWSIACAEYTTIFLVNSEIPVPRQATLTFVAEGSSGGEQLATIELKTAGTYGTTGWSIEFKRISAQEEELEELIAELEDELENGELSFEEEEADELALKEIEEQLAEEEKKGTTKTNYTPETMAGSRLRHLLPIPGRLTKNANYRITVSHEGAGGWRKIQIFTDGLWGSRYVFGRSA